MAGHVPKAKSANQTADSHLASEGRLVFFALVSGCNVCVTLICLFILLFHVMPQLRRDRSVLRAERLLLGPIDGPILAAIGESESGAVEFSARASAATDAPSFRLILDKSSARMSVGASDAPIALSSREGRSELVVGESTNASAVKLFQSVGTAGLMTIHPDSKGRSAIVSSNEEAQIVLFDPQGKPRVGMGVGAKGSAIALQDASEKPRLGLSVLGGESQLFVQDAGGSPLLSLHQSGDGMSFRVKPGMTTSAFKSSQP